MLCLKWIVFGVLVAAVKCGEYFKWDDDIAFDTSIHVECMGGRKMLPGAMLYVKQAYDFGREDDTVRGVPVMANQPDGSFRTQIRIEPWGNVNHGSYWYYYYFVNACVKGTAIRKGDVSSTYFGL